LTHYSCPYLPNVIGAIRAVLAFLVALVYTEPSAVESDWRAYEATAYVALCDTGCTGITRSGLDVRQTEYDEDGRRIIAVDTRVIPLGTALEIRLSSGYTFEAVAEDTGGDIVGDRVDILMPDVGRAWDFGRQDVQIRTLSEEETE
jgi:3D (Asp-Asp-Asp) domain-containing protein